MPRAKLRSQVLSPARPAKAVIASAANLTKGTPALPITGGTATTSTTKIGGDTSWQQTCWDFYDSVPEYHYAVGWVGNILSRATLYITQDGEKSDDKTANELLAQLYDGPEGQVDMLRAIGIHYTVAGDCYLFGVNAGETEKDDWFIAAANKTSRDDQGTYKVADETFDKTKPMVIRVWQPHPVNRLNSDSPSRAALTVLQELDGLTKKVAADIDSRLAGAGLLLIPNEISFGAPAPPDDEDGDPDDDAKPTSQPEELVQALIEVASISLADQSNAAAKVPVVLQGPGESLNQIKHVTFSTPLDQQAQALRTEAIRRLGLGMDMPPEILTGTSDMNHWSSWQLEEAAIKAHTEPLLAAICTALTEGYLRPMMDDSEKAVAFAIAADTTHLRLRPNRSEEAQELNDRGILTDEATARENGFDDPTDLMTPQQKADWLLKKVAQGSTTPQLVQAALVAMGVKLGPIPDAPGAAPNAPETQEARPTPSLEGHPQTGAPDPNESEAQAVTASAVEDDSEAVLTAAAGVMVYRALERAGNKIKSRLGGRLPGVKAADLYKHVQLDHAQAPMDLLLDDAWTTVAEFAPTFGVSERWLTSTLDSYTRGLILHRRSFDYETLRDHLSRRVTELGDGQ